MSAGGKGGATLVTTYSGRLESLFLLEALCGRTALALHSTGTLRSLELFHDVEGSGGAGRGGRRGGWGN